MGLLEKANIFRKGYRPAGSPNPRFWESRGKPNWSDLLPLRFSNKGKAKNVEVHFLVVHIPTT